MKQWATWDEGLTVNLFLMNIMKQVQNSTSDLVQIYCKERNTDVYLIK